MSCHFSNCALINITLACIQIRDDWRNLQKMGEFSAQGFLSGN